MDELLLYPAVEIIYGASEPEKRWKTVGSAGPTDYAIITDVIFLPLHINNSSKETYILKFLPFNTNSREAVLKEMQLQQASADLGVSPPVINAWFSASGGVIVMRKLGTDAGTLLAEYKSLAVKQLIVANIMAMIGKLHVHQISHGDVHFGNILTVAGEKKSGIAVESHSFLPIIGQDTDNQDAEMTAYLRQGYRFYLIDFGEASRLSGVMSEDLQRIRKDYNRFGVILKDLLNNYYSPAMRNVYETVLTITKQFE